MFIEIKNYSRIINDTVIFENINLNLAQGDFITIVGSSGCGKSTFLKSLVGLDSNAIGEFIIDGVDQKNVKAGKRPVSLMFQDTVLFDHLSVIENIAFPLKCLGMKKSLRNQKAIEILKEFNLTDFQNRNVYELSGGEKQRVALARAIITEPKLLLLDEPFSKLDLELSRSIISFVSEKCREHNITTILVTHDYNEARSISSSLHVFKNKNIFLDDGSNVDEFFGDGVFINGKFVSLENIDLNNQEGLKVVVKSFIKLYGVIFTVIIVEGQGEKMVVNNESHSLEGEWFIREVHNA